MDAERGNSWENDDGTISIVKTEIEDYDPAEHDNGENENYENYGIQYENEEVDDHRQVVPKQEGIEPEDFAECGTGNYQDYVQNNFQEMSSSGGQAENWATIQGYSTSDADPHFMNQPGTSDISAFAYKREAELYNCKYCDYVGSHPKLLTSHMKHRHIKSVLYQCPHCQYSSTVARSTRDHIQCRHFNEDDDRPIMKRKCEFCDYCASNATALKNHMNKHTKEVKHQCSFCDFNTLWEGYLKMHIRRKHGDQNPESGNTAKEYPCQYCDYKAATPSTLKLHTNKHTREQEHQCPYCPYKTVWTTYIKLHIQNKHFKNEKSPSAKEHPCNFCDYKAKNSTLLRQHLNKHTREKVHQCPHCPFNTLWVTYMKLHIKRKHTENTETEVSEKKDFQCQYCPYKAISLSHLKIHENKHTKAIEYKCETCDFKTTWYGYLKFHIKRKHSLKTDIKDEDEKEKSTFPCSFCPYKAINLSTLKVHQNKHTRENIYNCPHCDFKTTWRAYIKSHIQKHDANNFKTRRQGDASVKSFPCQYCDYVATQMGSLKLHVNSKHTRENMHKCPECSYECAVYGNLRMHVRRKHGLKPDEAGKYHCKECEFESENASEIRTHMNEKHDLKIEIDDIKKEDDKVYSCQYCSYTTLYQQVMKKHINKHTRQNVIKCPHCPYSTVWNHYMKVHIKRHNEPKTSTGRQRSTKPNTDKNRLFPCQYCDHRSLSFSSLRDHINSVHTREVVYKCQYCDHKCTLKGNLKGHIRRKHPKEFTEQEKRHQCEHCDFKTSERRNLKIHLKKEHNIDDAKVKAENGEYKCQFCEYKARSLYTLKIHRHKHTKENAFRCPQCEFATKWPNYLRKHIKQHSIGKSRVSCLYCEYKGCSTFRLRKHIENLHKKGDFYPCPKSNCLFKTIHYTSLRMHLKGSIHSANLPKSHMSVSRNFTYKYKPNEGRYFACDYCDYASKTQGNLDKHVENKHEKKAMKCGLCSYRTPSKNYLNRHYKLRHSSVKKEDGENVKTELEETEVYPNDPNEMDGIDNSDVVKMGATHFDSPDEIFLSPDLAESIANTSNEFDEMSSVKNRSRRKRSFVPYYAEESEDDDNEIICEDFLEVELGVNTGINEKSCNVEINKEQEEEVIVTPSIMDTIGLLPIGKSDLPIDNKIRNDDCQESNAKTEKEENIIGDSENVVENSVSCHSSLKINVENKSNKKRKIESTDITKSQINGVLEATEASNPKIVDTASNMNKGRILRTRKIVIDKTNCPKKRTNVKRRPAIKVVCDIKHDATPSQCSNSAQEIKLEPVESGINQLESDKREVPTNADAKQINQGDKISHNAPIGDLELKNSIDNKEVILKSSSDSSSVIKQDDLTSRCSSDQDIKLVTVDANTNQLENDNSVPTHVQDSGMRVQPQSDVEQISQVDNGSHNITISNPELKNSIQNKEVILGNSSEVNVISNKISSNDTKGDDKTIK